MTRILNFFIYFFVCLSFTLSAQQMEYPKMWSAIEQLEIDGKVSTALDKVNLLYKKAMRQKNKSQQLKALLFRWKFMQIIDEKSQINILNELTAEIEKQKFPNKQLLYMYKAHFLESYLNNNYWRINDRSSTEQAHLKNYQTWDLNTFLNEISTQYDNALQPHLALVNVPTKRIEDLLVTTPIMRKYKPTAYDIIAHEALEFYKNPNSRIVKPKDEFLINSSDYFVNSSTFAEANLSTTDTSALLFKALKTYQQLEKIHSKQKSTTAWVENALERLNFVKSNHIGDSTETLYLESLQNLSKEFKKPEDLAKIDVELAQAYRNLAFEKDEKGQFSHPNYNKLALDLVTSIEQKKSGTQTLIKAKNLKNDILQKKLNWLTQDKYVPNKKHLGQVTFTNCSNFTIKVFQVPVTFKLNEFGYENKDSLVGNYLSERKLHFTKTYALPSKKDHNTYTTEVIVPQLPLGNYVFQIQTDTITDSFKYHKLAVTEIGLNKTEFNSINKYQILNRYTGTPITNAKIVVKTELDRRNKQFVTKEYNSDDWGNFKHPKSNNYQSQEITVSTTKDTLVFSDYSYNRHPNRAYWEAQHANHSKTLVFLDRAIYRPGQKVYFKAIAIGKTNKDRAVISNQTITIKVTNPNNETVYSKQLTTNAYGSIHGDFELPRNGITGNFNIIALLDVPKNKNNHINSNISFSVEEYKRPTFEVTFLPSIQIYKPLDSIKLVGNAKAYLGTAVSNATVNYSVKRTTQNLEYWWSRPAINNSKQIATGILTTDANGNFDIRFKAETDTAETDKKVYTYTVEVSVVDLNGETREATSTLKVADKNLIATITTEEHWKSNETNSISITTTDVNGNPIKSNGTVKAYKLASPTRFLNTRPWEIPDIQTIDKSEFIEQFIHIPFTNENEAKTWSKGNVYFKHQFTNTDTELVNIKSFKNWPPGKYIVIARLIDPVTKAETTTEALITLEHGDQNFPADKQVFSHSTKRNPKKSNQLQIDIKTSVPRLTTFIEVFDGDNSIWKQKVVLEKGRKSIPVTYDNLKYQKLTTVFKYQIFNHFYISKNQLDLNATPVNLNITKKHFTDKISPGGKETWSFVINSSDKKAFNAEALATMYDASLDQFKSHSWQTNFNFGAYIPKPNLASEIEKLNTSATNFRQPFSNLSYPDIPKEDINLFGFDFNVINSWEYKTYLKQLKAKLKTDSDTNFFGKVIDKITNEPLPYVYIQNTKNKSAGYIKTNLNGEFELKATVGDTLTINFIGYAKQEIIITKLNQTLVIKLTEDLQNLSAALLKDHDVHYKIPGKTSGVFASKSARKNSAMLMMNAEATDDADMAFEEIESELEIKEDNLPDDQDKSQNNSAKIDTLGAIKARKNLKETAFFLPNLSTNKKGEIEFEFTSPEALTRWNFKMLAHTPQANSGTFSAQTLTQKELSIIPNSPRFVREGDSLRFIAKIANLTDQKMNGIALLEWTDPLTEKNIDKALQHTNSSQNFSIDANGNTMVNWNIAIPENLTAIHYKIVAKANQFTDGEENVIPVLSNRMLVTESVPIWVRPGETQSYSLANFSPLSATQKPHAITLEYTTNPAWMAIKSLPYLMEFPHEGSEQTFSRLYANIMAGHIINSQPKIKAVFDSWSKKETLKSSLEINEDLKSTLISESPWLQDAKSETEQQQRLANLFDLNTTAQNQEKAIRRLQQFQNSNGGFPWFNGGKVNPYITRHILAGFGHLEKLGVPTPIKTDDMVQNMIRFLDTDLIYSYNKYAKNHKKTDAFYKQIQLLHLAYARSFYLERFPLKGEVKTIISKVLEFNKTDWQSRSIYQKGLLALTLHRFEKSPITTQILTALVESAVNSKENGMYWKENTNSWWWYQSSISTQALLIEAFTETKQPQKYIDELKVFLLKNKRTNSWNTTIETADATYALLLNGTDWLSVKNTTTINVGGSKIVTKKLLETEKEQGTGYFKTSWNANEINPKFKTIKVSNTGKVTNYGGYYWQYFENLDNIKTDDKSPLAIDKELYKKVISDKGVELERITPKTPLQVGDKVTVRLLVKSDNDMEFVHLKDMRASGFEPTEVLSGYKYVDRLAFYQNTKDVATHFFIDRLPKGIYVLEYDVIANQAGSFSNGITQLQCMYAPEFSSHSAGQRVEISTK